MAILHQYTFICKFNSGKVIRSQQATARQPEINSITGYLESIRKDSRVEEALFSLFLLLVKKFQILAVNYFILLLLSIPSAVMLMLTFYLS
jgi:hypothetical protein